MLAVGTVQPSHYRFSMPHLPNRPLVGVGVYGLAEAARLSGLHPASIKRWLRGYAYVVGGQRRVSPPVFPADLHDADDFLALTFLDLMEARALYSFRSHGVSWKTIRLTHQRARDFVAHDHPFSTKLFLTDGRTILQQLSGTHRHLLLDLNRLQVASKTVLDAYLTRGLDFDKEGQAARWWPHARRAGVVLDPHRCFGQPIVAIVGIPTRILAESYSSEDSYEAVARWYDVPLRAVRLAVAFEQQLAA